MSVHFCFSSFPGNGKKRESAPTPTTPARPPPTPPQPKAVEGES